MENTESNKEVIVTKEEIMKFHNAAKRLELLIHNYLYDNLFIKEEWTLERILDFRQYNDNFQKDFLILDLSSIIFIRYNISKYIYPIENLSSLLTFIDNCMLNKPVSKLNEYLDLFTNYQQGGNYLKDTIGHARLILSNIRSFYHNIESIILDDSIIDKNAAIDKVANELLTFQINEISISPEEYRS